ncbi:putative benomyl methotrexate resistance protein [Rosellinia necatrix]|uniref:Putative benomyl methotrexate resistance protein n=1 Tax=Rosellinia necatrix TaxID=77044 RepID=A0A1W2TV00_ROSNE|nr:putative benomyl methotrexate resistance protein [Rosellinia necatrix]
MAFILQRRALARQVQQQLEQLTTGEEIEDGSATDSTTTTTDVEKATAGGAETTPVDGDAYLAIPGITRGVDHRTGQPYYDVGWAGADDAANPRRWGTGARLGSTGLVSAVAFFATAASSIDSVVGAGAAAELGGASAAAVESSLATALFLVGFGAGALLASPLSELVGRQPVYLASLLVFGAWTLGSALAPDVPARLAFRFLMGLSASAPLTVAGGSVADLWSPAERAFAYPLYAILGFGGAAFGPVVGTWIGNDPNLSWRWVEWLTLILTGASIVLLFLFKRETFAPRILYFKAAAFRKYSGDPRFKTSSEVSEAGEICPILKRSFGRPFLLCFEPIVISFTVYLTINYIILFTFLDGYPYIFAKTYGISENLSNTAFVGLLVGILLPLLLLPWIYSSTIKQLQRDGDTGSGEKLNREQRLYFAMIGAPAVPIGLFWMAWTDYSFISIWSPIAASVLIGFGIVCVFMSANMYIIDCYEMYAASALTFNALIRYIAAGGFTVIGIPLYENLGTHWTLTLLGVVSTLAAPIPFVLFKWGPNIRAQSKWAC